MADFWIKVEKSTPDKPEVFEMAEILGIEPDAVMGKLIRAWAWIDSNSANGHIKSVTNVLIDRVTMSQGFAEAMKTVGWLDENRIPNFDRHLGESSKKRAKDAERKRKSRTSSDKCHKKSVTESGLDKSRADKIREDNKKNKEIVDFSVFALSESDLAEVKRIRIKNKGGAITTQRVANGIAKEMKAAVASGFSVDDILTEWETRAWKSFKADWMKKPKATDQDINDHIAMRQQQLNALSQEPEIAPQAPFGPMGVTYDPR